jgi:hypothetical protein
VKNPLAHYPKGIRPMFLSLLVASVLLASPLPVTPLPTSPTHSAPRTLQNRQPVSRWFDATAALQKRNRASQFPQQPSSTPKLRPRPLRAAPTEQPGETRTFWIVDFTNYVATGVMTPNEEKIPIEADLVSVSDHAYLYVQSGLSLDPSVLEQLQSDFETNMYGTLVPVFGNPPDELDGDSHITILVASFVGTSMFGATAAGYFDDANEYTDTEAFYRQLGHSNEREMIYINEAFVNADNLASAQGIFAHEFQHLIHWGQDPGEAVWLNEGCSEYAMTLAGYPDAVEGHASEFAVNPTESLTDFQNTQSQYGAVYYFMRYLAAHYGAENAIHQIASSKLHSVESLDTYLRQSNETTFRQVYRDWTVTNLLSETSGLYSYPFESSPSYYWQSLKFLYDFLGMPCFFTQSFTQLSGSEVSNYLPQWGSEYYLFQRGAGETDADFRCVLDTGTSGSFEATYVSLEDLSAGTGVSSYILGNLDRVDIKPDGHGEFQIPSTDDLFAIIVHNTTAFVNEGDPTTVSYTLRLQSGVSTDTEDTIPPASITDLKVERTDGDQVALTWTAPGDDGTAGWATLYDLRYSTQSLSAETFSSATRVAGLSHPHPGGSTEHFLCTDLPENTHLYFLLRTEDNAGHVSWSNVPDTTTGVRDHTAPGRVTDLKADGILTDGARLVWSAPGDDGTTGQATSYDIRWSTKPITDEWSFRHAEVLAPPAPTQAGTQQTVNLEGVSLPVYVALRARDELGNTSEISNVPFVQHASGGQPPMIWIY